MCRRASNNEKNKEQAPIGYSFEEMVQMIVSGNVSASFIHCKILFLNLIYPSFFDLHLLHC